MPQQLEHGQTRKVIVYLPAEQSRFLDQEANRLWQKTGKKFSTTELLQVLIEQHRVKMEMRAEKDPNSVAWMYRSMARKTG